MPIRSRNKPIKQTPKRFAPKIMSKIKAKIERLLRSKFIWTPRWGCAEDDILMSRSLRHLRVGHNALRLEKCWCDVPHGNELDLSWFYRFIYACLHWWHSYKVFLKRESFRSHLTVIRKNERMRKHVLKMNPLKFAFCVQVGDFLGFVVHKKGIEINQNKTKAIREAKPP